MRLALGLSALLLTCSTAAELEITTPTNHNLNNQTLNGVELTGNGFLNLTSQGNSTIKAMQMFWLKQGAGASFSINSGTLNLDLVLLNSDQTPNTLSFDVKKGATLNLTAGKNGGAHGAFQGSSTQLNANIAGTLDGFLGNNGQSEIKINQGGTLKGGITQTGGTLSATIEGELQGSLLANKNVEKTSLWANKTSNTTTQTAKITGNLSIEGGTLEGILKGITLEGSYTQTGGNSDIAFHHSLFNSSTTLSDANTTIHFYSTTLKSISSTNGSTTINLKGDINSHVGGSKMEGYTGNGGRSDITLIEGSSMQSASQNQGRLSLSADASTIDGSITGSNGATLTVALNAKSQVKGNITNSDGESIIASSDSKILGSISQTNGTLSANLNSTELTGSFTQNGGRLSSFSATNSTLGNGIILTSTSQDLGRTNLRLSNTKILHGGIQISNLQSALRGEITDNSTINGGFTQNAREEVELSFSSSTLNDGVNLRDGGNLQGDIKNPSAHATALKFKNNSILNGGISANNHSLYSEFNNSTLNGGVTVTKGDIYLAGVQNSKINGDLTSQDTNQTRLFLSGSTFNGNVRQVNGSQHISLVQNSTITGSITNSNTNSTFANNDNSQLQGSYTQDGGTLKMLLGGDSSINANVELNNVQTTLGNGTANIKASNIKGNFTQNDGSLDGEITGLHIHGNYVQNGGTSNIKYNKATLDQPLKLNAPKEVKILFDDQSNLKTTTLNNSANANNSFTLDHSTILEGDFILEHSKVTLGVKNASKITGSIKSNDADNDLKLDFAGKGNEIGGDIQISNGSAHGNIKGTTINGSLSLTDANSHFHIIDSHIKNGIHITRGFTKMTLDHTIVGKGFEMNGLNKEGIHPTLMLRIGNGSQIQGDLKFINTEAFLGGFGGGNTITGSLISQDSILTNGGAQYPGGNGTPDEISGLTIQGDLKQENGILDLTFSNQSNIKGNTTLTKGTRSHLTLKDSAMAKLEVTEGKDNLITLQSSTQTGGIDFKDTEVTLKALEQSHITSNITATANPPLSPRTHIFFDSSTLEGNITQEQGELELSLSNRSNMEGNLSAQGLEDLNIRLNNSSIIGNFSISKSTTSISMANGSLIKGDLTLTSNPSFVLNSSASILQGKMIHSQTPDQNQEITLNFSNQSRFENTLLRITGDMKIHAKDSVINSTEGIELLLGSLDFTLDHSEGEIVKMSTAASNRINLLTTNSSNSTIQTLEMSDDSSLVLTAQDFAILKSQINLKETAKATLTSLSNANLRVDITPQATNTLTITLNGGILEGQIKQDTPNVGQMTLGSTGPFGGRWIMTEDSALNTLNITNSSGNISNNTLMQQNTYNTPISLIDTTYNSGGISRIGLELLPSNSPIAQGQTEERILTLNSLGGINGVFRLYTDIGNQTSDKIIANTASGNHILQVYYNPATYTQDIQDRYIVLAHVNDMQTTASFEGGETFIGTQSYKTELKKVVAQNGIGYDWILGNIQNQGANYGTKIISSILQSHFRSYSLQNLSFKQRMGELREINRAHGLWGRFLMGETQTPESDVGIKIKEPFYSAWLGYDHNHLDLKGQDFYGFALSYTLISPQGEDYRGKIQNFGFNFYNTFIARNDFYVDLLFSYILSQSSYEVLYYALEKNTPSYFSHALMLSAEIGKKFKLTQELNYFFIQPDFQITAGYLWGNTLNFTDLSKTQIRSSISNIPPVIFRTGLSAGYSLNQGLKSDFYVGTSFFYETTSGGRVHLDDGYSPVDYNHKGGFKMSIQGGFDLIFTQHARLFFEAGTSFLGKTNTTYSINAGARFSFGYKNTRQRIVPSSVTAPPPPPPPYDPRNIPVITDNTAKDIRNNATPKTPPRGEDYFINTRKAFRDKTDLN